MATSLSLIRNLVRGLAGTKLTAGLRRVAVNNLLSKMRVARVPLPTTSVLLGQFRQFGLGIRTQDFFRFVATERVYRGTVDTQLAQPPTSRLKRKDMADTKFHSRTRYQYKINMVTGDERYGVEVGPHEYWYGSNELLSPVQVEEAFKSKFELNFDPELTDWESLSFAGALKRPPLR